MQSIERLKEERPEKLTKLGTLFQTLITQMQSNLFWHCYYIVDCTVYNNGHSRLTYGQFKIVSHI